jgi:hypothetical protein
VRSLLALKLFGSARHSHPRNSVFDEGLGLFAGLKVVPKRSFLTEYSCRVAPEAHGKLMRLWFDAMSQMGLPRGASFDLDFHTVPFHGEDALMEKHYVSTRSRRQKGVRAFLARNADARVFCYANLDRLNRLGVRFLTLRRRSPKMLAEVAAEPIPAWRRMEIKVFHMDALSSAVAMKVDCDLQLTLMARGLHRLLGQRIGKGRDRGPVSETSSQSFAGGWGANVFVSSSDSGPLC